MANVVVIRHVTIPVGATWQGGTNVACLQPLASTLVAHGILVVVHEGASSVRQWLNFYGQLFLAFKLNYSGDLP